MCFTIKNTINAITIPAINSFDDERVRAEMLESIHVRWKVKHGRQLNGFLSSMLLNRGNMIGNILPKQHDVVTEKISAIIMYNVSIHIDNYVLFLLHIYSLSS